MAMVQFNTSWSPQQLFEQTVTSVSDDTRWLVQTQSASSLTLRREKGLAAWKISVVVVAALFTFGIGLLLLLAFISDLQNQQIVINVKSANGVTSGSITYTSGARKEVNTLLQSMPSIA